MSWRAERTKCAKSKDRIKRVIASEVEIPCPRSSIIGVKRAPMLENAEDENEQLSHDGNDDLH